jgi:AcrR family transcriptional regulator
MRKKAAETRERIIDAAYTLFYQGGFVRTGVDAVATAAGITKRTLYQHFSSKDTLIEAVLERQQQLAIERTRQWADHVSGDPEQMVASLFAKLEQWASTTGWQGSGFTRAALEFADLPGHPARGVAHRHKQEVEAHLAQKFSNQNIATAAALAREVMLLIEGCQCLVLIHGCRDYIDAAARAAQVLVRSHRRHHYPD